MRIQTKIFLFSFICLMMVSCAQLSSPRGGPRDEEPPKIDSLSSTTNEQVYFEKQNIKIGFNEFVSINKPNSTVLISPPMNVNPRIYARGKEIRVEMPEEEQLKENATYVINFGNAIRDYTEGNELENYSFIFSTGPYIDSLSISGTVVDAYSGEPAKETLVMLYDTTLDSVVYKDRPFYFARTDEDGNYEIRNMREDTFKLFALKDENVNYIYDLDNENIGFIDSLIFVTDSMTQSIFNLKTFAPIPKFDLFEYDAKTYGQVLLLFNQEADSIHVSSSTGMPYFNVQQQGDSLIVWYDLLEDVGFSLFIEKENLFYDTLKIRKPNKTVFLEKASLEVSRKNLSTKKILKPQSSLMLTFNHPLVALDTSQCMMIQDSIPVEGVRYELDSLRPHQIKIDYSFLIDSSYQFVIDSSGVKDIYGVVNDSLTVDFTIGNVDSYGKLIIRFDTLTMAGHQYLIELMQKEKVIRRSVVFEFSEPLIYEYLEPETYTLRITKDENKNGKWDPGSYIEKRFSEVIANKALEALREGWENEVTISADIFNTPKPEPVEEESTNEIK